MLAAALGALLAAPAAKAAPTAVYLGDPALRATDAGSLLPWPGDVCVDTDAGDAVTFTLLDQDGQALATASGTPRPGAAGTTLACTGAAAGHGVSVRFAAFGVAAYTAGASIVATQGPATVTVPLPFAAYEQSTGATGPGQWSLRVRSAPAAAVAQLVDSQGTQDPGDDAVVGPAAPVSGGGVDVVAPPPVGPAYVLLAGVTTLSGSTGQSIPYAARLAPVRIAASVDEHGHVRLTGANPLGAPAVATLYAADGTTVLDQAVLPVRAASGTTASAELDGEPGNAQLVTVTQPGWVARAVRAGVARLTGTGFEAGIPGPPGSGATGTVDASLAFAPAAGCPGIAATFNCSGAAFVVPGDRIAVTAITPTGDSIAVAAVADGASGSLDDGSFRYRNAAGAGKTGTVDLSNPGPGGAAPAAEAGDPVRADATGTIALSRFFTTHLNPGATLALHGPAFPAGAPGFSWNLSAALDGATLRGSTYPGGHVRLAHQHGPAGPVSLVFPPVDAGGGFALPLPDLRPGDRIDLVAANPQTHDTTTSELRAGQVVPAIAGVDDGQAVRGTLTLSVPTPGVTRVRWGGDLAVGSSAAPPFGTSVDTRSFPDGVYRIEASALGGTPAAMDYLYVTVDNTAPSGSAGPNQSVAPGRKAIIVPQPTDATSGVASVTVAFGDGKTLRQTGGAVGRVVFHVYRKVGSYRVAVTIRDRAGNAVTRRATVRVGTALAAQVAGALPTTLRHGRPLRTRLRAVAPGDLTVSVVDARGRVAVRRTTFFTTAGQRQRISLPTGKLRRGRYVTLWQFVPDTGGAGPIATRPLLVS